MELDAWTAKWAPHLEEAVSISSEEEENTAKAIAEPVKETEMKEEEPASASKEATPQQRSRKKRKRGSGGWQRMLWQETRYQARDTRMAAQAYRDRAHAAKAAQAAAQRVQQHYGTQQTWQAEWAGRQWEGGGQAQERYSLRRSKDPPPAKPKPWYQAPLSPELDRGRPRIQDGLHCQAIAPCLRSREEVERRRTWKLLQ